MTKQYQLIHIDTKEVTMCEKITIEGNDYYYKDLGVTEHSYIEGTIVSILKIRVGNIEKKLIATTNTSLQCPQVVDYVEELYNMYGQEYLMEVSISKNETLEYKNCLKYGYQKHSETHSLSDEEVMLFVKWIKSYQFLNGTKSESEYTYDELLTLFKSILPTKVYYR